MCSQRLYHTTSSKLLLVQCCSEKEPCLVLWLRRNNSLLCRQLPVLPWVKSPGLSSLSNGMGSSDKRDALIGITPCYCVSHETFWVPQYSPWTLWCLFEICNAFQTLLFLPFPRHPQVTLTAWKSLLQEIPGVFLLKK